MCELQYMFDLESWRACCSTCLCLLQYMFELESWRAHCEQLEIPEQVVEMEQAIQSHQALIDAVTGAYAEVR